VSACSAVLRQASLTAQSRAAVVELYGLQSRLDQARADLGRVEARAAALGREQTSVRLQLRAARLTRARAQRRLGDQLRYIYETGEADPIAVILGATSLEEAIDGLDAVHRTARMTRTVLEASRSARRHLVSVREKLVVKVAQTNQARTRLAATAAGLEQAQAERTAYLAGLRREQQLTSEQISRLERQAAAASPGHEVTRQASVASPQQQPAPTAAPESRRRRRRRRSRRPRPSRRLPPSSRSRAARPRRRRAPPPPLRPGGTMSVYATGYCLKGTTATAFPSGRASSPSIRR
jgi:peptidoglycan hydrolase CwlO-like protein